MSGSARVAALHYYPLKSARGIELERALLTLAGFEDDRRWMLVTVAGRFITQRELPRLALLRPCLAAGALQLSAPQLPPISIPLAHQGERRTVTVVGLMLKPTNSTGESCGNCTSSHLPFSSAEARLTSNSARQTAPKL